MLIILYCHNRWVIDGDTLTLLQNKRICGPKSIGNRLGNILKLFLTSLLILAMADLEFPIKWGNFSHLSNHSFPGGSKPHIPGKARGGA